MTNLIQWDKAKYWTGTFNPVVGCKPASEGCQNCYAERVCQQYSMNGNAGFEPTAKPNAKPPKSGIVFVGNMTDLFGEWNTDEQIDAWLSRIDTRIPNLILTKRAERMANHLLEFGAWSAFYGITAENQGRYNERIKAIRTVSSYTSTWFSAEPLLGPIDMQLQYIAPEDMPFDWVVVGAESGPNRRPCKLEWVESIVLQCQKAGIPVFVKQLDLNGKLVKEINEFPEHLRIRQVPWHDQVVR